MVVDKQNHVFISAMITDAKYSFNDVRQQNEQRTRAVSSQSWSEFVKVWELLNWYENFLQITRLWLKVSYGAGYGLSVFLHLLPVSVS